MIRRLNPFIYDRFPFHYGNVNNVTEIKISVHDSLACKEIYLLVKNMGKIELLKRPSTDPEEASDLEESVAYTHVLPAAQPIHP